MLTGAECKLSKLVTAFHLPKRQEGGAASVVLFNLSAYRLRSSFK